MAAVVLLTLAALAALVATRPAPPAGSLKTPEGVVTAFILAVQAGDAATAWSYVSPDATTAGPPRSPQGKPVFDRDEFQREVESTRGQARTRVRLLSVSSTGGSATVLLEVTSFSGSPLGGASSHDVSVTLARQGGSWLITSDPSPWQFT